jgi:hypothetical protein
MRWRGCAEIDIRLSFDGDEQFDVVVGRTPKLLAMRALVSGEPPVSIVRPFSRIEISDATVGTARAAWCVGGDDDLLFARQLLERSRVAGFAGWLVSGSSMA